MKMLGFIFALLYLSMPSNAAACSCAVFPDNIERAVELAYARADVIFLGDAITVRNKFLRIPPQREAEFFVRERWKGSILEIMLVRTNMEESACGYKFREKESYLVFGYWDRKRHYLKTSFCELTRTKAEAKDAIVILDEIKKKGRISGSSEQPVSLRQSIAVTVR